jgi:alkylation response protein AidB-like acyl-CoA dehydrogenase
VTPSVPEFRAAARAWLEQNAELRPDLAHQVWGEGSDSVALFPNRTEEEERAEIDRSIDWLRRRAEAGFANITWDPRWGGRGLSLGHELAYDVEELAFAVPPRHEVLGITTRLIAPTINAAGTDAQRERYLRPMLHGEELWCQLFSEPGAGSDLAGVSTRATRDGDGWILEGQKVWTSGAQFADWGYAICRTGASDSRHRGLTAFIVPMRDPNVEVRPLRQMTGGSTFNEVFLNRVEVSDDFRLGEVDGGWQVALTTLGFERFASNGGRSRDTVPRLFALAQHFEREHDPVVRQLLARSYIHQRLRQLTDERVRASLSAGQTPGAEGSIGKLHWTQGLQLFSRTADEILGQRLVVDTGEWGTFAWNQHLMGAAGFRLAGGTDEIQRNIIGERVLGLPRG